jgi:hypothetical protein
MRSQRLGGSLRLLPRGIQKGVPPAHLIPQHLPLLQSHSIDGVASLYLQRIRCVHGPNLELAHIPHRSAILAEYMCDRHDHPPTLQLAPLHQILCLRNLFYIALPQRLQHVR